MNKIPPPEPKVESEWLAVAGCRSLEKSKSQSIVCWLLILLSIIIPAVCVGFRCYLREPVSDDLLYRFILDEHPLGDNDYSQKVMDLGDAIASQRVQYFYSNGRFIVHVFAQMFTGPWGTKAFSIFTGILMGCVISLFGLYCFPRRVRTNPLLWIAVAITFLYLFQSNARIWYSVVGSLNYLYPISLMLVLLLLWRRLNNTSNKTGVLGYCGLVILGFVSGWSMECYSLPLAGGTFIILIKEILKRKKISSQTWVLVVSFWLGTAILVFAPGNFVRLGTRPGLIHSVLNGLKLLGGTYLFWMAVIGMSVLWLLDKNRFKVFCQTNSLVIVTLVVAVLFGLVANTLPQSFNGISLYSAILFFRLADFLPDGYLKKWKLSSCISALLLVFFSIHQIRIINANDYLRQINHNFVLAYLNSPDGSVTIPEVQVPTDVKPFISNWFISSTRGWTFLTIEKYYTNGAKTLKAIENRDARFYYQSEEYIKQIHKNPAASEAYRGQDFLWFTSETAPAEGDSVIVKYFHSSASESENLISSLYRKVTGKKRWTPPTEKGFRISADNRLTDSKNSLVGIRTEPKRINKIIIIRTAESK